MANSLCTVGRPKAVDPAKVLMFMILASSFWFPTHQFLTSVGWFSENATRWGPFGSSWKDLTIVYEIVDRHGLHSPVAVIFVVGTSFSQWSFLIFVWSVSLQIFRFQSMEIVFTYTLYGQRFWLKPLDESCDVLTTLIHLVIALDTASLFVDVSFF